MFFSIAPFIEKNLREKKLPEISPDALNFNEASLKYFDDLGPIDEKEENISPKYLESTVDLLTRFLLQPENEENNPFIVEGMEYLYIRLTEGDENRSLWPPLNEEQIEQAKKDVNAFKKLEEEHRKHELTDELITLIVNLIPYHNITLESIKNPPVREIPNKQTIKNIRDMVERSFKFLSSFKNLDPDSTFSNDSYEPCQLIINAHLPYITDKYLIDLTTSSSKIPSQSLIYHSIIRHLLNLNQDSTFQTIYIFNPRYGSYWELDPNLIPKDVVEKIKSLW